MLKHPVMRRKDIYYKSQTKDCTKYATVIPLIILCLTIATFAMLEVHNFYADQPSVMRMLSKTFKSSEALESLGSPWVQDQHKSSEDSAKHTILQVEVNSERQARAANGNNTGAIKKANSYYEEQSPVVVYAKTDTDTSIAQQQMAEVPPKQDADGENQFSAAFDEDYGTDDDSEYLGQQEQKAQLPVAYYAQKQQAPQPYYTEQQSPQQIYLKAHQSLLDPQYYDDAEEKFSAADEQRFIPAEARANYYRQYPYATMAPMPEAASSNNYNNRFMMPNGPANYNVPLSSRTKVQQQQHRDALLPSYDFSYRPERPQLPYQNRRTMQQMLQDQQQHSKTGMAAEEKPETVEQIDLLTIFKSIKSMWDLYQSFTTSWNTIAERHNREEEIAQQKYKQNHQDRINSKKPPKFNSKRNNTATTKSSRKYTTIGVTTVASTSYDTKQSTPRVRAQVPPEAKVEPRKESRDSKTKDKNKKVESVRDKRQTANGLNKSSDVAEGRYIKGDPLKGYYDFVITEGSYKFWAAFQVGTAILIIYSTFAAIYYSKVNPLVSDYDYTDYLGGARSLNGGELDFVDDFGDPGQKPAPKSWLEWLPRTSHSLKSVLDAIDKLPTDHAVDRAERNDYSFEPIAPAQSMQSSEKAELSEDDYLNETEDTNHDKEAM